MLVLGRRAARPPGRIYPTLLAVMLVRVDRMLEEGSTMTVQERAVAAARLYQRPGEP